MYSAEKVKQIEHKISELIVNFEKNKTIVKILNNMYFEYDNEPNQKDVENLIEILNETFTKFGMDLKALENITKES